MVSAPDALPSWSDNRVLVIDGRIPVLEQDYGQPPVSRATNLAWSFSFAHALRLGIDYLVSLERPLAFFPTLTLGRDGVTVVPMRKGEVATAGGIVPRFLNEQGQAEAFEPTTDAYDFGDQVTLCFDSDGQSYDLVITAMQRTQGADDADMPSIQGIGKLDRESFERVVQERNAARTLAQSAELAQRLYIDLAACPDPYTRLFLAANPELPVELLGWAATYPHAFARNPMAGMLLAASPDPVPNAPPHIRQMVQQGLSGVMAP